MHAKNLAGKWFLTFVAGEIPNEIGNLHNLKILDLGGNNIAGLIPSMIDLGIN